MHLSCSRPGRAVHGTSVSFNSALPRRRRGRKPRAMYCRATTWAAPTTLCGACRPRPRKHLAGLRGAGGLGGCAAGRPLITRHPKAAPPERSLRRRTAVDRDAPWGPTAARPADDVRGLTKGDPLDLDRIEGAGRVVIEHLRPEVDAGRFPVKRSVGQTVEVRVGMFADGHDRLAGVLRYRHASSPEWSEVPVQPLPNDVWTATFEVLEEGRYEYTVEGWVDPFATWRADTRVKAEAGQDISVELLQGAELVDGRGRARRRPGSRGRSRIARRRYGTRSSRPRSGCASH